MNKKNKLNKPQYNWKGFNIRFTGKGFSIFKGKSLVKSGFKNKETAVENLKNS